jgi:hypothetical protein
VGTRQGRALQGVAGAALALLAASGCTSAQPPTPQQQYETLLTTPFGATGIPGQATAPTISAFVFADSGPDNLVGAVQAKLRPDSGTQGKLNFVVFRDAAAARDRSFRGKAQHVPAANSVPLAISKGVGWCNAGPTVDGQTGSRTCVVIIENVVVSSEADPTSGSGNFDPLQADVIAQVGLVHVIDALKLS